MIPIALFGDTSYNHDTLRKLINSGSSFIPGSSTVDFDIIARERIFTAINNSSFNNQKLLIEEYRKIKLRLGRIPRLTEYIVNDSIDPTRIIEKYGSYPLFLMKAEPEYQLNLSQKHLVSLEFISTEIASGLRPHELIILSLLIEKRSFSRQELFEILLDNYESHSTEETLTSVISMLTDGFFKEADRRKFGNIKYIACDTNMNLFTITNEFSDLIETTEYVNQLTDVIEFGLSQYQARKSAGISIDSFVLYEKYTRKDVCKLLNWKNEESSTIYGYKIQYQTNPWNCPIFVTYEKSEDIQDSIKYEDIFIDNSTFSWMTRNNVRINSKEPSAIMNWEINQIRILLFVKKSDDEGRSFYYMGDMLPMKATEQTIKANGKELPIVNILFHMKNSVRQDIYSYFENIRT